MGSEMCIRDSTYALSAFVLPSSTKANSPPVTSVLESASVTLVRTKGLLPSPTVVTL